MNYESYDEYIQSKTYLIDEIPSHWEIVPMNQFVNLVTDYVANGSFASLRANVEYKNEEDYAILVRLADNTNNFSGPFVYIDEDAYNFLSKSKLYEGDIVLSNTGSIGSIFKVPNLGKPMSLGPNSLLIRFDNQILANYFFYLFNCDIGMKFLESITTVTTQPKFNKTDFRKLPMIMPPFTEQKQIANYLDKKTAKIDATIAKNEELIELLEEKRVALINQVVTKGLNPDVPMKDSGVEWIGEIPKHWNVEKIKNISQVKPSNVDKKSKDNEPPVLLCNYTDVYNNEFITMDLDFMKATATHDQINKLSLNIGDIIITKDSESADDIAVPAIVTEELENVVCGYHLAVIKPNNNIVYPKFLFRSFESDRINKQFELGANGVTRFGLGAYPINNAYICQPPLNEQKEIANYLDIETAKIFKATDKILKHIELLEEYKTSLIHHVVTGKIDVRGEEI